MKKAINILSISAMVIAVVAFIGLIVEHGAYFFYYEENYFVSYFETWEWRKVFAFFFDVLSCFTLLILALLPLVTGKLGSWVEITVLALKLFVAPIISTSIAFITGFYVESPLTLWVSLEYLEDAELWDFVINLTGSFHGYALNLGYALLLIACGMSIAYKCSQKKLAAAANE